MSRLVATVVERTTERALEVAAVAAPFCDLIEFRLDALSDPDPARLAAHSTRPAIFTCRRPADGGAYRGTEEERRDLLSRAACSGAGWVDVEEDRFAAFGALGPARRLVSHHDLTGTPDLPALADRLRAAGADAEKIAVTARSPGDVVRLLRLLAYRGGSTLAAHSMGPAGLPGRLLGPLFGTAFLYGAARLGAEGAPGQPTVRSLREDYGLDRDLAGAPAVLLLGGRLAHSVSPRMMNRVFRAAGIRALYVPWEVEDPAPVLEAVRSFEFAGAAVTIPLKERVAPLLDALDADAAAIGAVNTVVARGGLLTGSNTDVGGALDALREVLPDLAGKRALLLGAGGAGRALAFGLKAAGVAVSVVDPAPDRAARLAAQVGGQAVTPGAALPEADLLVNCSPVGQWPAVDETPAPPGCLRPGLTVFDVVYNPPDTRLLREARAAGARTVGGLAMLAGQGARQVERWLGVAVAAEDLRREGEEALRRRRAPVVLVGMRGAGKTAAGRLVAERLGRPFADLDQEVERRAGRTVAEVFATEGEAGFREREAAALGEVLRDGIVLALGGGAVERAESRVRLADSGARVVWLSAPPAVLAARVAGSGRPSLTGRPPEEEVAAVLARREALYRAVAAAEVSSAEGSPDQTADRVLSALGH